MDGRGASWAFPRTPSSFDANCRIAGRRPGWAGHPSSFFDPAEDRTFTFTPILEQLSVFADLIKAGKIRALQLSNETPWGLATFGHAARQAGLPAVVTVQNACNLINRAFDFYPAEAAHREHVGLLAYSPLAFGLLTGKYARGTIPPGARLTAFPQFGVRYRKPAVNAAVDAYVDLARSRGLAPAVLALAFVRSRWFVTSTIIGATHRSQLEENLSSVEVTLDADTLGAIDEIRRTCGPQFYAATLTRFEGAA